MRAGPGRRRHAPPGRRTRARAGRSGRARGGPRGRARPAPVGRRAGPAVRLQRRRERALRPEGDRAVRPRLEPDYFVNPPAFTYLLHAVFAVWFGGREGVSHAFATDPTEVFIVARVAAAVSARSRLAALPRRRAAASTGASACSRRRCWRSRSCPSSTPTSRSTTCRRWRRSRCRCGARRASCAAAACATTRRRRRPRPRGATKYTGGIVLLPLLAAAGGAARRRRGGRRRRALAGGLVLAGAARGRRVLRRQPVCGARLRRLPRRLDHQSSAADDALGKLGLTQANGPSTTCGRSPGGWAGSRRSRPSAALVLLARETGALALVLVPRRSLFVLFMGSQARFFGRWLLPVLPIVCLLAASRRSCAPPMRSRAARRRCARAATARRVLALRAGRCSTRCTSAASSRAPTRATSTAPGWSTHVRRRTKIVVEPSCPTRGRRTSAARRADLDGDRWNKFPTSRRTSPTTALGLPAPGRDRQHRGLRAHAAAGLIDRYERRATAGSSSARPSAAAPRPSRTRCPRRSRTTARSSAARDVVFAARPTARRRPGRRSTSTGRSTTTRGRTSGPGPR